MVYLTDVAVAKVKQLLTKTHHQGIRIGVRTTGCSGLAYVLEYVKEIKFDPFDERITYPQFTILISAKDMVYLRGITVDYIRNGLNEGFDFKNPNERDRCGCGISFRV
jgi:iron-sulfur cluster assembly protein